MDIQAPFQDLEQTPALTLWSLLQAQVEQLVEQFPLRAAWLVYQSEPPHQKLISGSPGKQRIFASRPNLSEDQAALKSYLDSEAWLDVQRLKQPHSLRLDGESTAYIFPLSEPAPTQTSSWEYLLLWVQGSLAESQEKAIARQVLLLQQLLQLNRRCRQQQSEIDLLEQILQRVGHQLGNPLALIRLSAETLTLELPPPLYRDQVSLICDTTDRIKTHLNDLIQCGRRSSLHLAPHNLQEILAESLQELRPWLDEKGLHHDLSTAFVTVAVDRMQLKQVFDNLLSNAIAFAPPNSTLTCHWQVFAHEVLVQIRDQGPGLSEADLKQVFTPFYSRRPGGKGLGLAIAQKIILDHQGRLWAENLPSGGAQFSFTLPLRRSNLADLQ
jgi:signal transduction histidine kinase